MVIKGKGLTTELAKSPCTSPIGGMQENYWQALVLIGNLFIALWSYSPEDEKD